MQDTKCSPAGKALTKQCKWYKGYHKCQGHIQGQYKQTKAFTQYTIANDLLF